MICPYCGHPDQKVLESRVARDSSAIRRRRECLACEQRFTTYEEVEKTLTYVVKRDGSREEFKPEKLLRSMMLASRKRGVEIELLQEAVKRIEAKLAASGKPEVTSREIGDKILEELLNLDSVAYVRFASVYKEFETLADFERIIASVYRDQAESDPISQNKVPTILTSA